MVMEYRGYRSGPLDVDPETGTFSGTVAGLRGVIQFKGATADELLRSFRSGIDEYLGVCAERGEEADRPRVIDMLAQPGPEADFDFIPPKADRLLAMLEEGVSLGGGTFDREALYDRKKTIPFVAYVRKTAGSDYGVEFPDVPGCISAGRTLDEARTMAAEALAGHLALLEARGMPVPTPSTLEALSDDPNRGDAVMLLVDTG